MNGRRKPASTSTLQGRSSNGPTASSRFLTSRTRLLIDALEDELEELATDEEFRRRLSDAYYDGRIGYDTVEAVLGREEALRMKLLRNRSTERLLSPTLRMVSRVTMPSTMAIFRNGRTLHRLNRRTTGRTPEDVGKIRRRR